jgi:threonine dehydrogenase-like Zn-dependent dehydrogenase
VGVGTVLEGRAARRLQQHAVFDQHRHRIHAYISSQLAAYDPAMTADVLAATLVAPGQLELRRFPYPDDLESGAVLLKMLASGICGTDKHTFRGETQQYAGTDHASSTPFPIIQGHENVGIVTAIGAGGATAFDGTPLSVGDRVVPAPNRACGECEFCRGDYPYYFCRRLENYGNSLTCAEAPFLFGGWAEHMYLRPNTPVFRVPDDLPTNVAVLTELFAVTHSLDLAAKMPRPGGFRPGDTVAVVGIGPVGVVHVAKAALMGASRVIAIDPFGPRVGLAADLGATDSLVASGADPAAAAFVRDLTDGRGVDVVVDATGHPASFNPSLTLLRDGGTLIEVGAFVDLGTVPVNPATILGRNLTIVGVAGEDARAYDSTLAMLAEHHERVPFHHAVTHTFPLEQVEMAMQTALGADTAMKVVLTPTQ